jgi:hypothetical protein
VVAPVSVSRGEGTPTPAPQNSQTRQSRYYEPALIGPQGYDRLK